MFSLNYYKNLKTPSCLKNITISEYVHQVKHGYMSEDLLSARQQGKGEFYNKIKSERPCVTINFHFKGYKKNENIQQSTGLLYYDIDGIGLDELCQLDYNKIYVAHKSFGGNGTCLILKVSGITQENFKEGYQQIANELGISDIIDMNAIKKTQSTVLSYDPDLVFNESSSTFIVNKKVSSLRESKNKKSIYPTDDTFLTKEYHGPLRNTNAADLVPDNEEYRVFPKGVMTAKVIIPRNIKEGKRTYILLGQLNNVVALNPQLTYPQVVDKAFQLHHINTFNRLTPREVLNVVDAIWRYKIEGTLKPIYNKKRKIIFNNSCTLSKEEKRGIVNVEVGKWKREDTKEKIRVALESWDIKTKITAKKIAEKVDMGSATVKRYWPHFKELVRCHNAMLKSKATSFSTVGTSIADEATIVVVNENIAEKTLTSTTELSSFLTTVTSKPHDKSAVPPYSNFFRDQDEQCPLTNICRLLRIDGTTLPECG